MTVEKIGKMEDNRAGSDDDLNELFDRVSNKLGWKSDANLDELFEQLSQSTQKKKKKRSVASGKKKKKKSKTITKKKTRDLQSEQSKPSRTSPCSSTNSDVSSQYSQDSTSREAGIRNEISRNLKLQFQAEKKSSRAGISVARKEEGEADEVPGLRLHVDTAPVISAENNRLENFEHSREDEVFENKENLLTPKPVCSISERTNIRDGDVVTNENIPSKNDESCDKSLSISKEEEKKNENDVKNLTEEFTESPQLMQWLMSPPASKSPLQTLNSDSNDDKQNDDSSENDADIEDILGPSFPSLSERLARNHLENKRKESASRKNRRRSCANPRAAPFVLDNEWAEDEEKSGQEDSDNDRILDGQTRLEAEGDGEEERTTRGRSEDKVTNVSKGFEDQDHNSDSQTRDGPILNTHSDSFQKARTKYQDSSSDDDFESFLNAVKTPKHPKQQSKQSDSDEAVYVVDDDDFINDSPLESRSDDDNDDGDVFYLKVNNLDNPLTSGKRITKKHPTVGSRSGSILSQLLSSSEEDDEDKDIFVIPNPTPSVRKPKSKVSTSTTSTKKTPAKQRRPLQPTTLPSNRYFSTPSRTEQPASVSFLASLSTPGKGMSTRSRYVSDFKRNKDELTQKLFKLYNESVFENKLPSDFSITWNNRMRKTAGFCFYKKRLNERTARIELSVKVCDTAERLRDTLIHELCHAAAWLIHGVSDGHGKFWKYWAAKSNLAHPEIPVIKRCHTYEISTKYKYKCVQCGNIIGRHSKSVDTKRFCCAYCNGRLELQPTLRKDGTPARARGPNPFASFVKENYASVKKTHGAAKHADVMRLLSQEFSSKTKITDT